MDKQDAYKENLKSLRQKRAPLIEQAKEKIKENNSLIKKIKTQIKDQAMTIPELSKAIEEPSSKVLIYVSGLKKFGQVVEKQKQGEYFKYQLSSIDK